MSNTMKRFSFIFFHFLIGWGILLSFNSCTLHRLSVQTQYLSHESLASYHVGTPDPRLYDPVIGQRLLIQWSLCAQEIENQELSLYLKVRFRNRQSKKSIYLLFQSEEPIFMTLSSCPARPHRRRSPSRRRSSRGSNPSPNRPSRASSAP